MITLKHGELDKTVSLSFFTCKSILTRSNGATAVLANAPAAPPAISSFTYIGKPSKTEASRWEAEDPSTNPTTFVDKVVPCVEELIFKVTTVNYQNTMQIEQLSIHLVDCKTPCPTYLLGYKRVKLFAQPMAWEQPELNTVCSQAYLVFHQLLQFSSNRCKESLNKTTTSFKIQTEMLLLSISKLNLAHITKSPQSKEYPETIKKKNLKGQSIKSILL